MRDVRVTHNTDSSLQRACRSASVSSDLAPASSRNSCEAPQQSSRLRPPHRLSPFKPKNGIYCLRRDPSAGPLPSRLVPPRASGPDLACLWSVYGPNLENAGREVTSGRSGMKPRSNRSVSWISKAFTTVVGVLATLLNRPRPRVPRHALSFRKVRRPSPSTMPKAWRI